MSDKSTASVPIWMLIVCWIAALPLLIDGEYWMELKVLLFLPLVLTTIFLVQHRRTAAG